MPSVATEFANGLLIVRFQPARHEDRIRSVSIGVAINNENYSTFVDPTGAVRERPFDLESLGLTVGEDSVINVAVGLEGQDGNVWVTKMSRIISIEDGIASITNLRVIPKNDGSGRIDLWYDYNGSKEVHTANIYASVQTAFGEEVIAPSMDGDVGEGVRSGQNRKITWDARKDIGDSGRAVLRMSIEMIDEDGGVGSGDSISGTFIYDPGWEDGPLVIKKGDEISQYGLWDGTTVKTGGISFEAIQSSSSESSESSSSSSQSSPSSTTASETSISSSISSSSLSSISSSHNVYAELLSPQTCLYFRWASSGFSGPYSENEDNRPLVVSVPEGKSVAVISCEGRWGWLSDHSYDYTSGPQGREELGYQLVTDAPYSNATYSSQNIARPTFGIGAVIGMWTRGNSSDNLTPFLIGNSYSAAVPLVEGELATEIVIGFHDQQQWINNWQYDNPMLIRIEWYGSAFELINSSSSISGGSS